MHQSSHAALQYSKTADNFMNGIYAALTQDVRNRQTSGTSSDALRALADREGEGPSAASFMHNVQPGPSKPRNPLELLRTLAAEDASRQSEETIAAVNALPPVPLGVPSLPASRPASANSMATPGRAGRHGHSTGITPRKIGAFGATPRRETVARGPSPANLA